MSSDLIVIAQSNYTYQRRQAQFDKLSSSQADPSILAELPIIFASFRYTYCGRKKKMDHCKIRVRKFSRIKHSFLFALVTLFTVSIERPAEATSGPGCLYVVNVANWDALNMRSRPSARSTIVDRLKPDSHGIIRLNSPCIPLSRPWASRWCPVTHYNGYDTVNGWVKARYVRDSHCP